MPAKKKAAETVAPAKTTTRKTTRKPAVKSVVTIQYAGKEMTTASLVDQVKAAVPADTVVKTVNVYVKPEENKAYYVVNGEITGDIDL